MSNAQITDAEITAATESRAERVGTYGTVQHRDVVTNQVILNPKPSSDPNDPLNWSQGFKYYITALVCLAMVCCNYLAAGPTIQIVETTFDFFPESSVMGHPGPLFTKSIAKVAYFFTTTALFQGLSNLLWIPLMNKYGRRPAYVVSYALYFVFTIWAAFTTSYGSFLASRMAIGLAAGAAEGIAPVTISDCFFLHERGAIMAFYTMALSIGVVAGIIVDGMISIHNGWRVDYYVAIALVGTLWVLIFFTFPETAYHRNHTAPNTATDVENSGEEKTGYLHAEDLVASETLSSPVVPRRKFGVRDLKVFHGTFTQESLGAMMLRPFVLLLLPQVFWASLVMAVTIGFLVAITSNFASAFQTTYGFEPWKTSLCYIAGIIGSAAGIFFGGHATDMVADFFTRRNGGVREPEMRLPAIAFSAVTGPLALVLYGCGIQYAWHWIVPTIGLGLLNSAVVQATNVSLLYTIDSYRPIAGELATTQLAFKSAFGFLLSFYTNVWVAQSGYANAFGAMAGISVAVILCAIPLYIWGKALRRSSAHWGIMRFVHWDDDRQD
ncbi:MFS general substrate transporter-27 [Coleophoma crateriformis]|uniref:MFS general substrate transporter-27 n=1 Tax=Coleophoma crateriformis TaxID=565419 RepID=A0A3D8TA02_9HELO|nr:MFS general substrate transporter-27 [Coleophoma crateriformis]